MMPNTNAQDRIATPANIVTMTRIFFIPLFMLVALGDPAYYGGWQEMGRSIAAGVVFLLLSLTDGIDGYLARSRNEVSTFGKLIDPIADKVLVMAAFLVLVQQGVTPAWMALVVVTREFLISGLRMLAASRSLIIAASWSGKAKTATTIVALALNLFSPAFASVSPHWIELWMGIATFAMWVAIILTIASGVEYFVKCWSVFKPKVVTQERLDDQGSQASQAHHLTEEVLSTKEPHTSESMQLIKDVEGNQVCKKSLVAESNKESQEKLGSCENQCSQVSQTSQESRDEQRFQLNHNITSPMTHFSGNEECAREIFALSHQIIEEARRQHVTLATAESCTAGMVSAALTEVPGASLVFNGGIISYTNAVKERLLCVDDKILNDETQGAVSTTAAQQMAQGALNQMASSLAVSVTGMAGPTSNEPQHPVGQVFIGLAYRDGQKSAIDVHEFRFEGDRNQIRAQATRAALRSLAAYLEMRCTNLDA